ncbi:hypothetical protein JCM8547_002933 [Rhodosporidiobolus lusitaniae]
MQCALRLGRVWRSQAAVSLFRRSSLRRSSLPGSSPAAQRPSLPLTRLASTSSAPFTPPAWFSRLAGSASLPSFSSDQPLSDEAFSRLFPLQQTAYALTLPVPTSFTPLQDQALSDVLFGFDLGEKDAAFYFGVHWERLEFRLWYDIISDALFLLGPPQLLRKGEIPLRLLSENMMGEKLARSVGLDKTVSAGQQRSLADLFEAYLTALYYSNGPELCSNFSFRSFDKDLRRRERFADSGQDAATTLPSSTAIDQQLAEAPDYSIRPEVFRQVPLLGGITTL